LTDTGELFRRLRTPDGGLALRNGLDRGPWKREPTVPERGPSVLRPIESGEEGELPGQVGL